MGKKRIDRLQNVPRICVVVFASLLPVGCNIPAYDLPDQSQFKDLETLQSSQEAIVRLYLAPFPLMGPAVHPWFEVKPAGSDTFTRWEVWWDSDEPYGYLRKNLLEHGASPANTPAYIIAELTGAEAESVIQFIDQYCSEYPARHQYSPLRGPNCCTFVQWVLDNTGWNIMLPGNAFGRWNLPESDTSGRPKIMIPACDAIIASDL